MSEVKEIATPEEVEERVDWCYLRLLEGLPQREIVDKAFTEKGWGVTKRQIRTYVQRATEALANEIKRIDRRAELAKAIAFFERVRNRLEGKGDDRGAMMAEEKRDALLNLSIADALQVSWEAEAKEMGYDPASVFEHLVNLAKGGTNANA